MIKKVILVVILFSIGLVTGFSQTKYVNEFLNIGVGARAHGMFNSVVATSNEVTSAYWNPAGMVDSEVPFQIAAMHTAWFGGISNYDYIGIAKKLNGARNSYGALTIIRFGIDNIPNTLNLIGPDGSVNYERVTSFSAVDYAFIASYGTELRDNFSVGLNAKVVRRVIGTFGNSWGFGFDASARYKVKNFKFGLMLKDITTTFNAWSFNLSEGEKEVFAQTNNEIPVSSTELTLPRAILGAAYIGGNDKISYTIEADFNISTDGAKASVLSGNHLKVDPSFGFELGYKSMVFLRAGVGNLQRIINEVNSAEREFEFQPNVGLGVKLGRITVDYALTNIGGVSKVLKSHIFSLKLDFHPRKSKEESMDI